MPWDVSIQLLPFLFRPFADFEVFSLEGQFCFLAISVGPKAQLIAVPRAWAGTSACKSTGVASMQSPLATRSALLRVDPGVDPRIALDTDSRHETKIQPRSPSAPPDSGGEFRDLRLRRESSIRPV
jgi:hypothetical protein